MAVCAAVLVVAAWLPWMTGDGGARANAIGGSVGAIAAPRGFGAGQAIVLLGSTLIVAGAMAGRGLSERWASAAGLVISLGLVALTGWYYTLYVKPPVSAGYGLYVGGVFAMVAAVCSIWALIGAGGRR